jgi:hypothetical protein
MCTWSLDSSSETSNLSTPCTFANKFFYIPPLVQTSVITDFLLVCERKIYYYYMKESTRIYTRFKHAIVRYCLKKRKKYPSVLNDVPVATT